MRAKTHIIAGLVLSLFLLYFIGFLGALLVFLSSFLIDTDYLLYYFYRKKRWSFSGTYEFAKKNGEKFKKLSFNEKKKYFRAIRIFHGVETLIILFILGYFFSKLFYFVLIGSALHLIMDWIHEFKNNLRHDKFSIILSLLKFKKLKQVN